MDRIDIRLNGFALDWRLIAIGLGWIGTEWALDWHWIGIRLESIRVTIEWVDIWFATDWSWIGAGLVLDWSWIGTGWLLDCLIRMHRHQIGTRLASDIHRIDSILAQDWDRIGIRLTFDFRGTQPNHAVPRLIGPRYSTSSFNNSCIVRMDWHRLTWIGVRLVQIGNGLSNLFVTDLQRIDRLVWVWQWIGHEETDCH